MKEYKIEFNGIFGPKQFRATLYQKTNKGFKRSLIHYAQTKEKLFKETTTKIKRLVKGGNHNIKLTEFLF